MKKIIFSLFVIAFLGACSDNSPEKEIIVEQKGEKIALEKITFPSLDSLPITANLYYNDSSAPIILLCHQARYNKFEYTRIAETLVEKGFNCIAIDQRSGGPLVEENNETMLKAKALGKPIDFLDAEQDIIAAVDYVSNKYNKKIILWGSSYSSTLALWIALDNKNVAAVISFSPGDYFIEEKGSLTEKLKNLNKPMFVTSSKEEATETTKLLANVKMDDTRIQYVPKSVGTHGSRALWQTDENHEEYWTAISPFLESLKKINYSKE